MSIDPVIKRCEELSRQITEAAKNGNYEEVKILQKELIRIHDEVQKGF